MGRMIGQVQNGERGPSRLPYQPPHLGRVSLAADEVLGFGCKASAVDPSNSGSGNMCSAAGGPCRNAGVPYGS